MIRYSHARLGVGGVLLSLWTSVAATSQESTRPVKSIFGVYGQPNPGRDSIRVVEKANDLIGVSLRLYYANGHTCQLNKDGTWSRDHVAIVADGLDPNRPCRLNLFFENHRVVVKDDGLGCAPVYCGTRGKLDNASLPKFNPDRK
jgi:hypothetical protein